MSFSKYSSGNILTQHSKKIGEFQKNIEELKNFNTKIDSKIKTLVKDFNQTIININNMFVEKSVDVNVNIDHNFEKIVLPKNTTSKLFGSSIDQTIDDYILVGDPLYDSDKGCVYIYQKNQYNNYSENQILKHSDVKYFGQHLSVFDKTLVVSALDTNDKNKCYLYIFQKGSDLWEKYQIIEINSQKEIHKLKLQIYNDNIVILINALMEGNMLHIYQKNQENKFEQIKTFNHANNFSLYNKTLALSNFDGENNIFIYDMNNNYSESQKLTLEKNIKDLYLYDNKLLVLNTGVYCYEKNSSQIWSKNQEITISESIQSLTNVLMNKKILIVSGHKTSNGTKKHSIIYIYKLDKNNQWKLLRTLHFDKNMNHIHSQISLLNNKYVLSNYHTDDEDVSNEVYVINEFNNNIKWRGEYFAYMNKIDLQITGEYFSDNLSPHFTLKWNQFKLPTPKKNFYYKNIPNISINIYDLDDDSYRNDLKISQITFDQSSLEFFIQNIHTLPYNFIFNINISYLAD